jgi:hypothetical protein
MDAFLAGSGYGRAGSIPPEMTFLEWCQDLAAKGLEVDARPFNPPGNPGSGAPRCMR